MMHKLAVAALAFWIAVITGLSGTLLARHLTPLPPASPPALAAGLEVLRGPPSGRIVAFHVLLAGCRCSRQVARALATSPRPIDVEEHILLVDDLDGSFASTLTGQPFVLHSVRSSDLEPTFGIAGAPLLIVVGGDGSIRYSGGYTDRKQGLVVRDRQLIDAVSRGERPASLPLYGCATAESVRGRRTVWGIP